MATIHDVAKSAGVASKTVSRVINNEGYISSRTREKVNQAIAELGYVPNALARSLRSKRTNTLALIITDITNPFFTVIARGVEDTANNAGYNVIFCNSDESQEKEEKYVRLILQKQVDGILLVPAGSSSKSIDLITEHGTPVVVIDRKVSAETDRVSCDSEGGAYQLTRLLLDLGHRRITLLNGPVDVSTSLDRFMGYQRAMDEAGLSENISSFYGSFNQASGYEGTKQALSQSPRPTALFAANNVIGIGTLWALQDLGLNVPDDIAVVAFDDLPTGLVVKPSLTVAAQPAYEMGRRAAELMLNRLHAPSLDYLHVTLPVEIITRSSSGKAVQ